MVTKISKKKSGNPYECPMTDAIAKIGGRWKPIILFYLSNGSRRFGQLAVTVPMISKKVLTEQLKDLVEDGLISRRPVKGSPPRVDYELTELGQTALPILDLICEWGKEFGGTAVKKRAGGKSV